MQEFDSLPSNSLGGSFQHGVLAQEPSCNCIKAWGWMLIFHVLRLMDETHKLHRCNLCRPTTHSWNVLVTISKTWQ